MDRKARAEHTLHKQRAGLQSPPRHTEQAPHTEHRRLAHPASVGPLPQPLGSASGQPSGSHGRDPNVPRTLQGSEKPPPQKTSSTELSHESGVPLSLPDFESSSSSRVPVPSNPASLSKVQAQRSRPRLHCVGQKCPEEMSFLCSYLGFTPATLSLYK